MFLRTTQSRQESEDLKRVPVSEALLPMGHSGTLAPEKSLTAQMRITGHLQTVQLEELLADATCFLHWMHRAGWIPALASTLLPCEAVLVLQAQLLSVSKQFVYGTRSSRPH